MFWCVDLIKQFLETKKVFQLQLQRSGRKFRFFFFVKRARVPYRDRSSRNIDMKLEPIHHTHLHPWKQVVHAFFNKLPGGVSLSVPPHPSRPHPRAHSHTHPHTPPPDTGDVWLDLRVRQRWFTSDLIFQNPWRETPLTDSFSLDECDRNSHSYQ